jgi:hypothetical protein
MKRKFWESETQLSIYRSGYFLHKNNSKFKKLLLSHKLSRLSDGSGKTVVSETHKNCGIWHKNDEV